MTQKKYKDVHKNFIKNVLTKYIYILGKNTKTEMQESITKKAKTKLYV